ELVDAGPADVDQGCRQAFAHSPVRIAVDEASQTVARPPKGPHPPHDGGCLWRLSIHDRRTLRLTGYATFELLELLDDQLPCPQGGASTPHVRDVALTALQVLLVLFRQIAWRRHQVEALLTRCPAIEFLARNNLQLSTSNFGGELRQAVGLGFP